MTTGEIVGAIGFAALGFVVGMFVAEPVARATNDAVGILVVLAFAAAFGVAFVVSVRLLS